MDTAKLTGSFRVKYWGTAMILILILGPLSYPPHFSAPLRLPWLAVFCTAALALVLPDCRAMWLLRSSKTPRWITLLMGIVVIAATIALLVQIDRDVIRLSHLHFWIPVFLGASFASLCAWICEARHAVRIYCGLGGFRYVPNSVAINPWAWLRFGGYFSVEPEGEKKKFILRRAKVHLLRVGADLLKVFLILLAVYFASMPFWPLAVPPVPAELKAKYPVPEFQPRGNGEAEKIWFSLYPAPLEPRAEPPELLAAPLYRFSETLNGMEKDPDWTSPEAAELRGWLAKVEPEIHRMAGLCQVEDPPDTPLTGHPCESMPLYKPLLDCFKVLPGIHALDGNAEGTLKAIRSGSRIAAYHTRSDSLIGWLVGNILSEISTPSYISLYAQELITPAVARELEQVIKEWQAARGTAVRAVGREQRNVERMIDVMWKKAEMIGPQQWGSGSMDGDSWDSDMFERYAWMLRRLGWMTGNGYRAAKTAQKHLKDRLLTEAVIWSDVAIGNPVERSGDLLNIDSAWPRKGWMATILAPRFSEFYRRYYAVDANHRIGHALAAIGAYRYVNRALPTSLEEAYAVAGLQPDLQTPYVDQVPEYRRLDAGAPEETNTYAFTLTIWGDGGRCNAKGGVSWLVVRNPVFGDQPLRCWQWKILEPDDLHGIESQEVKLIKVGEKPLEWASDRMGYLGVPAELLGTDADQISETERTLRQLGWEQAPIPPNRHYR